MSVKHGVVILGCACALIAGCGGGNDTSSDQSTAEGFWHSTISTNYEVDLVVLENGETWGTYTRNNQFYGLLYGNTAYKGDGKFTGTGLDFRNINATSNTYSGDFVAKDRLTVKFENSIAFTASYKNDYDQPAPPLANLAGTYAGHVLTGSTTQPTDVSISASGNITFPSTNGCAGSGTIRPRLPGKSVYAVSVTFKGSSCVLGNGTTVTGVGAYDTDLGIIEILALNSNKSKSFIYIAMK
jgi:hypothetical protein